MEVRRIPNIVCFQEVLRDNYMTPFLCATISPGDTGKEHGQKKE